MISNDMTPTHTDDPGKITAEYIRYDHQNKKNSHEFFLIIHPIR
jgi:hypothetical protein